MIELRESEIDALVRCGRLLAKDRANINAIRKALYGFIEHYLPYAPTPAMRARPL
jgi:hypothetical protein